MEMNKAEVKKMIKNAYWELKSYFPRAKNIKIKVKQNKGRFESKIAMEYLHKRFYSHSLNDNIYDALAAAEDSIMNQFKKQKRHHCVPARRRVWS
jgi:ribosome-associated translation inhibitor RaiA